MKYLNILSFVFAALYASAQSPIFIEKTPTDLGLFIVKTEDGKMGVIDNNDNFVIPLDSVILTQWFPPESHFFISQKGQPGQKFQQNLYNSAGELLFSNVNIGYVGLGAHLEKDDKSYRDFFVVQEKGMPNKLLFHKKNGQILPDTFSSIDYGGRNSTFLALHLREKGAPNVISVFDLEGKKLFSVPPEIQVMHSGHPNMLLATKSNPPKMGLIYIDKGIDSTSFEFDNLRKMWTGWFVFSKDNRQHFGLLDTNGKPCGSTDFTKLGEPNRAEIGIFSAKIGSPPIATGVRAGMENPTWIGIDSLGREHFFSGAAPSETIGQMEERLRRERVDNVPRQLPDGSTLQKPPSFPGGELAMGQFLSSNLRYPKIAQENGIEGTVVLQITVEADGQLTNISIKRDIGNGCGLAAVQCFEKMPRWSPAVQDGKAVASSLIIPVRFKLTN